MAGKYTMRSKEEKLANEIILRTGESLAIS